MQVTEEHFPLIHIKVVSEDTVKKRLDVYTQQTRPLSGGHLLAGASPGLGSRRILAHYLAHLEGESPLAISMPPPWDPLAGVACGAHAGVGLEPCISGAWSLPGQQK